MKFSGNEKIELPMDTVFKMITDFETHERTAMRRGAELERVDDLQRPGEGMKWRVEFRFRGQKRKVNVTLQDYRPSEAMSLALRSPNVEADFDINLSAITPQRTQMNVKVDLRPKTLAARLLINSMRLAKGRLNKRFKERMAIRAREMELRAETVD